MNKFTAIIPVHIYNETVKTLLSKAIDSYYTATNNEGACIIVAPTKVATEVLKDFPVDKYNNLMYVESKKSDFSSQINVAVKEVATPYFTILEFDDTFTPNWFKNVNEYLNANEDVSIYLPLTEVTLADETEKGPIGYVNESVWASSFSNEIGYLDLDCLQDYMNFNTTGGVFKTEDFISVGGLKTSMKLTFWYEFLMRALYQNKKIYVIPKVGYQHLLGRDGSVSDIYNTTMSEKEADWWIELAKKEYYFKSDRKKTYEE